MAKAVLISIRLGWVRFIAALPLPGWLKMLLWGWV